MLAGTKNPGRLMSITQAAKYTPYTSTFLRQLARNGKLPAAKIGRDWLVTRDDLMDFIHQQTVRHEQAILALELAVKERRP